MILNWTTEEVPATTCFRDRFRAARATGTAEKGAAHPMTPRTNDPLRPATAAELHALEGTELGPTGWYEVTQARVDAFAELTEDRQWIHLDVERASVGPFGATIVH